MKRYNLLNNLFGWISFLIASVVYIMTIEPTSSFWDCGEYIATAFKLQVGHPPGAPLFQLVGRLFSLLAGDDLTQVAKWINTFAALSSSFSILFLFWTITALTKKFALSKGEDPSFAKTFAIIASGLTGAMAYTFSDTFWFSAVEGEVYATSSFFTALVFWAILKWEAVADEKHSDRWIVLIAYLVGLSIGVHLLNLLAIPALAFVYYFRKFAFSRKGLLITFITSIIILGAIQYGIIPGLVKIASKFELLFVNGIGLPFNSGIAIYFIILFVLLAYGLYYTTQKQRYLYNTMLLCLTVIIIGYSSYTLCVVRSAANTPMDENNPENVFSLLSYLNREQYGDRPLFYGQYYNTPLDKSEPYKDGDPVYSQDKNTGKYYISDDKQNSVLNYDRKFCAVFPRMWSNQANHISAYKEWGGSKGTPITTTNSSGQPETIYKPTFGENLKFFFTYQIGHMYLRYFFWNFAGRQNDIQGHGSIIEGNWLSGIDFIDSIRLGPQEKTPESMKNNKARNKFYFLPLILGLIGMFFHFKINKGDATVVMLLFFFTGLAIVIYLNQYPYQPRERDYAYAASFYAFAIWIGMGVYAIFDKLASKLSPTGGAVIATLIGLFAGPAIMAKDGWNDHDRSNRYTARDFAYNYLNSCAPNAILFTNGDNDTFPLWYIQEVECVRTDVRVVNLSLLNTDWYINQMKRKAYEGEPVPFSLTEDKYIQGTRDYLPIYDRGLKGHFNIDELMAFIASEDKQAKLQTQGGHDLNYFPTGKISIPVDSAFVVSNGTVPEKLAGEIVKSVDWEVKKSYVMKNDLMILDLLSTNDWKRPVYFAITVGDDAYIGLDDYFQLEGLAFRLIPVRSNTPDGQTGRVNTDIMYENLMKKFKWGNMFDPKVYMDENNIRMTMNLRNNFSRLADNLIREGKKDKALEVLDKCIEIMPDKTIPYNYFVLPVAEGYYRLDQKDKANAIVKRLSEIYTGDLDYYLSLKGAYSKNVATETQQAMAIFQRLASVTKNFNQDELNKELTEKFTRFQEIYQNTPAASARR